MAPVLVLRLALRGVSGFWPLHQVTTTRKLQSRHEMDYMEEEAGGVARATLEGGPPVLTIPPCLSRCHAGKTRGSLAWIAASLLS